IMGKLVRNLAWIPDKNNKLYNKPSDLPIDALSEDFILSPTLTKQLGMKLRSIDDLTKKINEAYKQILGGNKVEQEYIDFVFRNKEVIDKL
ncbi:MAG: hypothetical protein ACYT04_000000100915, partial [Nostoc sp.]